MARRHSTDTPLTPLPFRLSGLSSSPPRLAVARRARLLAPSILRGQARLALLHHPPTVPPPPNRAASRLRETDRKTGKKAWRPTCPRVASEAGEGRGFPRLPSRGRGRSAARSVLRSVPHGGHAAAAAVSGRGLLPSAQRVRPRRPLLPGIALPAIAPADRCCPCAGRRRGEGGGLCFPGGGDCRAHCAAGHGVTVRQSADRWSLSEQSSGRRRVCRVLGAAGHGIHAAVHASPRTGRRPVP